MALAAGRPLTGAAIRVGLDATAVSEVGKGLSRVQRSLAETLTRRGNVEVTALVRAGVELASRTEVVRERPAVVWEQVGLARAGRRFDVVLTPTERLPLAGGRFVIWLFETPGRRIAQNRGAGAYKRTSDLLTQVLWRRSLRRAAAVATGSQATARELEAAVPELAGRVCTIYPGLDEAFGPGPGAEGTRYVFHLGSDDPRDNTETVVRAMALARERLREPVRLVVGGNLRGRRFDNVEQTGRVSDEELVRLYRGAAAYLDASRFEGFGYQALEAMACGAPFVGSNATSIPEVVGEAGLLCDPGDAAALADALVRVLEESDLAEQLRRRGLERAADFTWDRTAETFERLLSEVSP